MEPERTRDHLKDMDVNGKILLKSILNNWVWECELDLHDTRQSSLVGSSEICSRYLGSVNGGEFLEQLSDYQISRKALSHVVNNNNNNSRVCRFNSGVKPQ
jgi:hypothetical protein